jgi:alkylation response protein AidB-like acyl-CoA dehydrogenase
MSAAIALARRAPATPIAQGRLDALTAAIAVTAEAYDRSAEFPRANFDILAREGLIGLTVSPELGGGGAGFGEALRVIGAVARGEPSTALILFMTYGYHLQPTRAQSWPAHIYQRLAREAVAGGGLIGGLRVEPVGRSPGARSIPPAPRG